MDAGSASPGRGRSDGGGARMRKAGWWSVALAAFVAVAGLAAGAGADDATSRKELNAAYDRIAQAYRDRDVKALMALCTADYTGKLLNGKTLNREQQEA